MKQLVYNSFVSEDFLLSDIAEILQTAREFNKSKNITGCLLYSKGEFLQLLEGDGDAIMSLYHRIAQDKRHTHVHLLYFEDAPQRAFENWAMAFCDQSDLHRDPETGSMPLSCFQAFLDKEKAIQSPGLKLFRHVATTILNHPYENA